VWPIFQRRCGAADEAVGIFQFGYGYFDRDSDDEPMDGMG